MAQSPAADPFAAIANKPAEPDPFAGIATPEAPAPGFIKSIQNRFDTHTATSPTEPLLKTGLKRVVGTLASPIVHPLDTLPSMSHMGDYGPSNPLIQRANEGVEDYHAAGGGLPGAEYAGTKLAGDVLGTYLGGKVGEAGVAAAANVPHVIRGGLDILAGTDKK